MTQQGFQTEYEILLGQMSGFDQKFYTAGFEELLKQFPIRPILSVKQLELTVLAEHAVSDFLDKWEKTMNPIWVDTMRTYCQALSTEIFAFDARKRKSA